MAAKIDLPARARIIRVIDTFTDEKRYPPTLIEITEILGVPIRNKSQVFSMLKSMRKEGYITFQNRSCRTFVIMAKGYELSDRYPPEDTVLGVQDSSIGIKTEFTK